jgi:DNA/RNA endonuclease YhcR with UshA esterase domain
MSMPETAMYEYRDMSSRHDNIRGSWQTLPVQPETIACFEQHASNQQFGLRVLATNARHHFASLRGGYNVHDVSWDWQALSR